MAYKPYRGSGYYGRRRHKIFALILLLLLLAAVFVFFYVQEYIVFTADGFRFSFRPDEPAPSGDDPDDPPSLIIEDPVAPPENPGGASGSGHSDPADPTPDVQPAVPMRARLVSGADELRGLSEPFNALALTVKGADGLSLLSDGTAVSDALTALKQEGGRAAALASALRDNVAPRDDLSLAVRTQNGVRWLDYDNICWLNPYAAGTADVLAALAQACFDAGFDELVLQNFQFPTRGKTQLIGYGEQTQSRTEALTALLAAVREKAPAQLALSVVLTDTAARSLTDADAGQDVAQLAPYCARLYVRTSDPALDLTALAAAAGESGGVPALLLSGQSAPAGETEYILIP